MQFFPVVVQIALAIFAPLAHGATALLSYDQSYGAPEGSLTTVACSDGSYGMIPRGYATFGSLPHFPFIGGAEAIEGWNSPNCGSCYQLTYTHPALGYKKSINITAIDRAQSGFNVALPAMQALVGPNAATIGTAKVDWKKVGSKPCGL